MGATLSPTVYPPAYEKIDNLKLANLQNQHSWIVDPIYRASEAVLETPFFAWLDGLQSVREFRPAAVQLYYHSATFPKVMGLMLAHTSMAKNGMMPFYAKHAFGEADHSEMLMQWMLKHGVIHSREEINEVITTLETNACVNYAYQMALEQDRDKWLVGLNSGIERCSNDFFKRASPKMHALGAGDEYCDVHVEADAHHSIMRLDYIKLQSPTSFRGKQLIAKALEGISLWAAMLNSWIGVDCLLKFDETGRLLATNDTAAFALRQR